MTPIARRALLAGAGAGAASLGGTLAWHHYFPKPDRVPSQALWSAALTDLDGRPFSAAQFLGRPLLVNFWATWCPPCIKELPDLNRFYNEAKARQWQVLGIALDGAEPVKAFLQKTPLDFPIALAGAGGVGLTRLLGNLEGALPFSIVLDGGGEVTWRRLGTTRLDELRALAAS